jgi:hypothetical protein
MNHKGNFSEGIKLKKLLSSGFFFNNIFRDKLIVNVAYVKECFDSSCRLASDIPIESNFLTHGIFIFMPKNVGTI